MLTAFKSVATRQALAYARGDFMRVYQDSARLPGLKRRAQRSYVASETDLNRAMITG